MTTPSIPPENSDGYQCLADRARQVLSVRADPRPWIENNLWVRSKEQRMVRFRFWPAQANWYQHRSRWDVILKARQLGFTSVIDGCFFADAVLRPNTTSVIVVHDLDSAEKIFATVRGFWERLPEGERGRIGEPRYLTRRELYWPSLNSRFWVGTAGSVASGRGHTINNLHCSEFAYWPDPEKVLAGLTEAVPLSGRIVVESTARGVGNPFHDLWIQAKQGENPYRPHFYPWWWDQGYRMAGPPLGELTEEEQHLRDAWHLDDDQLRWRREKRRQLRDRFPQEYPENDGHCFLASGRCCFEMAPLLGARARIAAEPEPQAIAHLADRDRSSLAVSPARLLVWRTPEQGREYVIGADVGEGLVHGDASCAIVLDRQRGEEVAELHGRIPPDRFARLLNLLGRHYRLAMLAVERNNHGHSVLNVLQNVLRYPRLYHHVRYDYRRGQEVILGWPTDQSTKPILVDDLAAALLGGDVILRSAALVDELMTFVSTDSGSQEAQPGKFDDRVIALGVAWQARKRGWARASSERPPGW